MKITAITRYKHGELYAILRRIGWTQSELSRQTGIHPATIGNIINLAKRPTAEQADAIQKALGIAGEYLDVLAEWPETFEGLKPGYRREQTADVPLERLLDHPEVMQLAAPEYEDDGLEERVEDAMSKLSPRHRFVLRERFWNGELLATIARRTKTSRERVQQIEAAALRELRHPARLKSLTPERCGVES